MLVLLILLHAEAVQPETDELAGVLHQPAASAAGNGPATRAAAHGSRRANRWRGRRASACAQVDCRGLGATRRDPLAEGRPTPALPAPQHRNAAPRRALLTSNQVLVWYPRVVPTAVRAVLRPPSCRH